MILLNPGPVTLSARVRRALSQGEDLCHREPECADLTLDVLRRLGEVHPSAGYAPVLLTGSGTCAVEAMLSTFAPRERPTLVVCNGVYGERMAAMLARQRKPVVRVQGEWTSAVDVEAVRRVLDGAGDVACMAVVHHETTTGRLNDLAPLAAMCRARGIGLLVDAVSSFGGEALPLDAWQPLAVAGTANKCLHGVPGICFVLARSEALGAGESHATSLYLDLATYHAEQRRGGTPFTPAVQALQALQEALAEFAAEGGWEARRRLYLSRSQRVRETLLELGVQPLIPLAASASMLTAFRVPEGMTYARLHDGLKAQGFTIYAGQGSFDGRIFRIATMGSIGEDDLERLVAALRGLVGRPRAG